MVLVVLSKKSKAARAAGDETRLACVREDSMVGSSGPLDPGDLIARVLSTVFRTCSDFIAH
jgi:hypothetical protein